ncbi:MAG: carboxypeptidase-like regulatory domain-containing protein [Saprospiraceae bacterium]
MRAFIYLGILVFLAFGKLGAQNQLPVELKGRILDAKTKEAINGANLFDPVNGQGASTNKKGFFELKVESLPVELEITVVGYEKFNLSIYEYTGQEITVFMEPEIGELPEAVVSAERQPEEVFQKRISVIDFVFYGNNVLLLIKDLDSKKIRLELQNTNGEIIDSMILEELLGGLSFHKTCLSDINIIDGKNVHQVILEGDIIFGLGITMPYNTYNWEVKKCVLANSKYVYYQLYSYFDQLIDYHLFAKNQDTNYVFTSKFNKDQIRLLYEDMAPLLAIDKSTMDMTANTYEILDEIRDAQETLDGRKQFYYQPIYCPLFQIDEKLILFDHIGGEMALYNFDGTLIDAFPIEYQKLDHWEKIILQDELTGDFYTVISANGGKKIIRININDGTLAGSCFFRTADVGKMDIMNQHLFYLEKVNDPVFGFKVNKLKRLELTGLAKG